MSQNVRMWSFIAIVLYHVDNQIDQMQSRMSKTHDPHKLAEQISTLYGLILTHHGFLVK